MTKKSLLGYTHRVTKYPRLPLALREGETKLERTTIVNTEQRINQIIEESTDVDVEIRHKISLLNSDLYSGPLYFDKDGDECSMFDFDAKPTPFDFSRVAGEVMDYLRDNVPNEVFIDMDTEELLTREPEGWTDEETGEWIEPFWESIYHVEDVHKTLLGRELYSTIARY